MSLSADIPSVIAAKPRLQPKRFTLDGSDGLEAHLVQVCERVRAGVQGVLPPRKIRALVLGGGYGRGQGGVLKTSAGDEPYNDLEFYVFLAGSRLVNEYRYRESLNALAQRLSPAAGLHLEFKIDSLRRWYRSPVSMFSYDLVSRHRILWGRDKVFEGCEHHLEAPSIPLAEATRLLFNRCTGLLLAKDILQNRSLTIEQADFVGRNLAKLQLALGDSLLAAFGRYHWNCLERYNRLSQLAPSEPLTWLKTVREHHALGVEFKLHPRRLCEPVVEFRRQHQTLSTLAREVWLWLENQRLDSEFVTPQDYASSQVEKCGGTSPWRNYLLSLKMFGPKATWDAMACRYPRERLFNALALMLWNADAEKKPDLLRDLQHHLHSRADDWGGLLAAYKRIWEAYG